MKKIETVWCQLLYDALERKSPHFQQQELAKKLQLSTSTVNFALKDLRRLGAVRIGGNGGAVTDAEKLLMHWANHRNLAEDVIYTLKLDESVSELEGLLPADSILGGYSAVRHWYGEAPADYNTVHVYHGRPEEVRVRFSGHPKGESTVIILKFNPLIPLRPETTTLAHTFVDLWNLTDWMAKDFIRRIKQDDELTWLFP